MSFPKTHLGWSRNFLPRKESPEAKKKFEAGNSAVPHSITIEFSCRRFYHGFNLQSIHIYPSNHPNLHLKPPGPTQKKQTNEHINQPNNPPLRKSPTAHGPQKIAIQKHLKLQRLDFDHHFLAWRLPKHPYRPLEIFFDMQFGVFHESRWIAMWKWGTSSYLCLSKSIWLTFFTRSQK